MVKKKGVSNFIYWAPRILSLVFILFLSLFSLDVFGNGYNFWQTVAGLFMHNIPSLILLVVVLISWKRYEIVGGIAFILAGLVYFLIILVNVLRSSDQLYQLFWTLIITGPALFIGILFLINWFKRR